MAPIVDEVDVLPPKGVRPPVIGPGYDLGTATDRIAGIVHACAKGWRELSGLEGLQGPQAQLPNGQEKTRPKHREAGTHSASRSPAPQGRRRDAGATAICLSKTGASA